MKVILSRKGFDSSTGDIASPILSDGTLLSLPIPGESNTKYSEICYKGKKYSDIIHELYLSKIFDNNLGLLKKIGNDIQNLYCYDEITCHLDPDIRKELRCNPVKGWKPAFGQTDNAQGQLRNAGVEPGDIFMFFGWFRSVDENYHYIKFSKKKNDNNFYRYADLQVIYGYMQIGEIITDPEEIKKYYWHPHSEGGYGKNNTLYIPSKRLIINGEDCGPGYGTLDFDKKRVLTKEGKSRANWDIKDFLLPDKVYGNKKNSSKNKDETIYYAGQWQELIINDSPGLLEWVKEIIV